MSESPYIFEATLENFSEKVLEASVNTPVLVDYWADWCAPCKNLMPVLAKLAEEYAGAFLLAKVNTDEQQELAMHSQVRSLPTVRLFVGGQPVDEFMGALPESEVRAFLERHITAAEPAAEADSTPEFSDIDEIQSALEANPDDQSLRLQLATALLSDSPTDAAALLDNFQPDDEHTPQTEKIRIQIQASACVQEIADPAALLSRKTADDLNLHERSQLAALAIMAGEPEQALSMYMLIMQSDRSYEDDLGYRGLLDCFKLYESETALLSSYRRRLASLLN